MKKHTRVEQLLHWEQEHSWETARGICDYMIQQDRDWFLMRYSLEKMNDVRDWNLNGIISSLERWPYAAGDFGETKMVNVSPFPPTISLPELCHIQIDLREAGRLAADYFINLGFDHIYYLTTRNEANKQSSEHIDAFCDTLNEAGYPAEPLYVLENFASLSNPKIVEEIVSVLKKKPKPFAVYCNGDNFGAKLTLLCRDANLRVPDDVAILGQQNMLLDCKGTSPPLSSVDLNYWEIGFQAARILDLMFQGKEAPEHTLISPKGIITRQSTNILAIQNDPIRNALYYIREHFREKINMDKLALSVGLSRRTMEYMFRETLRRSPYAEVLRLRFDKAEQLLKTTSFSLEDIAERSGFNTAHYLSNMFKKHRACSPSDYRKTHTIHSAD